MDGSRDHHTTGSKSERERQMPYDITYMWKLTYDTNEHIDKTETVDTCLRSKQSSLDYVAIFRTEFQLVRVCPLSFRKNHTYVTCFITNRNDLL